MNNGNGKNTIKIMHWNGGSKFWIRKVEEIELIVDESSLDLIFMYEANLFSMDHDYQTNMEGHTLYHPKSMSIYNHSRLILLARSELNISIQLEHMEPEVASIWVKIVRKGMKKLLICGIYREHSIIFQNTPNATNSDTQQLNRWKSFISKWTTASRYTQCIVLGDFNLNYLKWTNPELRHRDMVNLVKN